MKNILKLFAVFSTLTFLFGCNTEDKDRYSRVMIVESVPEGIDIVVDSFKVGKTPLTVEVATTEDGCFVRKTVITAIPSSPNLNTQIKTFPAFRVDNDAESSVPEKIIFNMEKKPSDADAVIIEN